MCVEAVWQAAFVAAKVNFSIFFRVVGFLEYGNKVSTTFVEMFVAFDVGWVNFNTNGGETFRSELNGFADPFNAAHTFRFTGKNEDIL